MLRGVFFSWIACFAVAVGVLAQTSIQNHAPLPPAQEGSIQGTVQALGGRPLAEVRVRLHSEETGSVKISYTNAKGHFSFFNLPSGKYLVEVEALGYQAERQRVRLGSSHSPQLSFILKRNVAKTKPDAVFTVSVRQLKIPKKARKEYRKGLEQYEQGKIEEAIKHWHKSLKIYPRYVESYLQLSRVYFDREDLPRAQEMAQDAVAIDQGNANTLCILGYVYLREKNYPEAKEAFMKSVRASHTQWLSHFWLAWLLLRENKAEDAYEHAALAAQLRPGVPEIHIVLFNSLLRLGRIQEAVKELDYFLEHFPNHPMAGKVLEERDSLKQFLSSAAH